MTVDREAVLADARILFLRQAREQLPIDTATALRAGLRKVISDTALVNELCCAAGMTVRSIGAQYVSDFYERRMALVTAELDTLLNYADVISRPGGHTAQELCDARDTARDATSASMCAGTLTPQIRALIDKVVRQESVTPSEHANDESIDKMAHHAVITFVAMFN